ncbi:hypothetical protein E8E11_008201 [Didymella keratinophila]|nr:hypothetical protein E8E11_008201 [Didymella keratinophila]
MTTEARSQQNRTQLIAHFDDFRGRDTQSAGWSSLWDSDKSDLWDRGRPSDALVTFLWTHPLGVELGGIAGTRPLKAFVPGCGRGHDVAMLALNGFEAWGLEVSQKATDSADANIKAQLAKPTDDNSGKGEGRSKPAVAEVLLGDFFERDWESQVGTDFEGFDIIYDYTFLCALLPSMRQDWAQRMSQLLSPTGMLVCLEFPMWKPLTAPGPPYGLNGVYWNILAEGGTGVVDDAGSLSKADGDVGAFERIAYWKPPISFEQGRGEDMISVWKLWKLR